MAAAAVHSYEPIRVISPSITPGATVDPDQHTDAWKGIDAVDPTARRGLIDD